MLYPAMNEICNASLRLFHRVYLTDGIAITEKGDNVGTYFPRTQLRALVDATLLKIRTNPDAIDALHRKTIALNRTYFALAQRIERMPIARMRNTEIARWYERILRIQKMSHGISLPTTWFVDADNEDFSKYLLGIVEERLRVTKTRGVAAEIFSTLTTPLRDSMQRIEEKEMLGIFTTIARSRTIRRLFTKTPTEQLRKHFEELPLALQKKILVHYRRWRWTPYTYIGPIYELDYYLVLIAGMFRERVRPVARLAEYRSTHRRTREKQQKLFKQLDIAAHEQKLFRIAQDIVHIKGFRKDCLYYGCYVRDLLLEEVARRLHITRMQAKYFIPEEVPNALRTNTCDVDVLNARIEFSIILVQHGENRVLCGDRARVFLRRQKFERVRIPRVSELKGMCASPGKVRGTVRVVNFPEEMVKMKKGDVMLAHTTFPALVPAMKMAAAIVTEDGGITCHAAIVSRELKIPCIVGMKIATQVLHDGDRVEVDATKGIVRKLT